MNVCQLLPAQARESPIKTALMHRGSRLSYQQLEAACARVAGTLLQRGVRSGDAAVILLPMSATFYTTVIALLRIAAIPVLIDPGQGHSHLERCCNLIQPRVFIGSPLSHLLLVSSPALRRIPLRFSTTMLLPGSSSLFSAGAGAAGVTPVASDTPALITFTSGSTGLPKAIARSHGFLLAQHRIMQQSLAHATGDIVFSALPVFILSHLAAGLACVLPGCDLRRPGNIRPDPVIAQLASCAVTSVEAPPSLLEQIVQRCLQRGIRLGVRRFLVGGAPVFPPLIEQLKTISPGCEVINIYGSTEAEPIAHMSSSAISVPDISAMRCGRGLLVGKPVPAIRLRVLAEGGEARTITSTDELQRASLPPGEIGEIAVSGDHVLSEYLHAEDVSSKFRVNGVVWHRTGDVGYLDHGGQLWLLGRVGTSEDARGKLYPLAMEVAMSFCPTVQRSAFFALRGERILALQLKPHSRPDPAILAALSERMPIDKIWEVAHIPTDKRHNSKIDYIGLTRCHYRREYKISNGSRLVRSNPLLLHDGPTPK